MEYNQKNQQEGIVKNNFLDGKIIRRQSAASEEGKVDKGNFRRRTAM